MLSPSNRNARLPSWSRADSSATAMVDLPDAFLLQRIEHHSWLELPTTNRLALSARALRRSGP
jgi:hypothetical protein